MFSHLQHLSGKSKHLNSPQYWYQETFPCNRDSLFHHFQESPNTMYMRFLAMGNAMLQKLWLMNVLSTAGKNKQWGCLSIEATSIGIKCVTDLFHNFQKLLKMIAYISFDQWGGKNESTSWALISHSGLVIPALNNTRTFHMALFKYILIEIFYLR